MKQGDFPFRAEAIAYHREVHTRGISVRRPGIVLPLLASVAAMVALAVVAMAPALRCTGEFRPRVLTWAQYVMASAPEVQHCQGQVK